MRPGENTPVVAVPSDQVWALVEALMSCLDQAIDKDGKPAPLQLKRLRGIHHDWDKAPKGAEAFMAVMVALEWLTQNKIAVFEVQGNIPKQKLN